jgi:hypothetical protein
MSLFGWLATSQQCFSLTANQHQPPSTCQPAVFFLSQQINTSHQPAEQADGLLAKYSTFLATFSLMMFNSPFCEFMITYGHS